MENCPCGSNQTYSECCQKYHSGDNKAASAELLMRARYSAFVENEIDYIMETFHEDTRAEVNKEDIAKWASSSEWKGLEIVSTEKGQASDSSGVVEFKAKYEASGKKVEHHEKSRFEKVNERWYFVDGDIVQNSLTREGPKIGRNDPCPCGSGKKYKKCCY